MLLKKASQETRQEVRRKCKADSQSYMPTLSFDEVTDFSFSFLQLTENGDSLRKKGFTEICQTNLDPLPVKELCP